MLSKSIWIKWWGTEWCLLKWRRWRDDWTERINCKSQIRVCALFYDTMCLARTSRWSCWGSVGGGFENIQSSEANRILFYSCRFINKRWIQSILTSQSKDFEAICKRQLHQFPPAYQPISTDRSRAIDYVIDGLVLLSLNLYLLNAWLLGRIFFPLKFGLFNVNHFDF